MSLSSLLSRANTQPVLYSMVRESFWESQLYGVLHHTGTCKKICFAPVIPENDFERYAVSFLEYATPLPTNHTISVNIRVSPLLDWKIQLLEAFSIVQPYTPETVSCLELTALV